MKARHNLFEARVQLGLSQTKVCDAIGIDRSYYSEIETGKATPSLEYAMKIAEFFDRPLDPTGLFDIQEVDESEGAE